MITLSVRKKISLEDVVTEIMRQTGGASYIYTSELAKALRVSNNVINRKVSLLLRVYRLVESYSMDVKLKGESKKKMVVRLKPRNDGVRNASSP